MKHICLILCSVILLIACKKTNETPSAPMKEEVRGVWVPDPSHTNVMKSYQNVVQFVESIDSLNLNTIFVASYALSKTIYPSQVLLENSIYINIDSTFSLMPYMATYNQPMKSPSNDPVRDLIDEAHKRNIKVFLWFEFGFMGDMKPMNKAHPIYAKHPDWLGLGNDGKGANYNNHDYYFNSYHPEVQEFLIKLIEESLTLYPDLDGVQGDDRLPAMARNSGYDKYTVAKYQAEHNGAKPPHDFNDSTWVRWRLNILNDFGKTLYTRIKAKNSNVMLSFSPNPYPWCEEKLMQEWPQWVETGICDLLNVQCYRYEAEPYENTVKAVMSHIKKPEQLFAPGIILRVSGEQVLKPEILRKQMEINRALGTNGEVFFYNEGLRDTATQAVLREFYTEKAKFPALR